MMVKAKILLVEDDADLRASLAEVLELEGYVLRTAGSAQDAIGILQEGEVFDLIISDYYMRNGSGMELLRFVRTINTVFPPFFLITGQSEISGSNARAMGAQEFISKPFDITQLFELLERYLSGSQSIARTEANSKSEAD